MTNEELWKAVLGQIELSLSKANFITWFKNTSLLEINQGKVLIGVPNGFAKEWLENKYNNHILKALRSLDPSVQNMRCTIALPDTDTKTPRSIDAAIPRESSSFVRKKIIEKPSFTANNISLQQEVFHESSLNSRYTFENYIVAENNELAHAACHAVSQSLGTLQPSFYLWWCGPWKNPPPSIYW